MAENGKENTGKLLCEWNLEGVEFPFRFLHTDMTNSNFSKSTSHLDISYSDWNVRAWIWAPIVSINFYGTHSFAHWSDNHEWSLERERYFISDVEFSSKFVVFKLSGTFYEQLGWLQIMRIWDYTNNNFCICEFTSQIFQPLHLELPEESERMLFWSV